MADEQSESQAVEKSTPAEVSQAATPKRHCKTGIVRNPYGKYGKRGHPDLAELSKHAMSKNRLIQILSGLVEGRPRGSKDFWLAVQHLEQLRGWALEKPKSRQRRSKNGLTAAEFKDIRREEAKRKREALAKESDNE